MKRPAILLAIGLVVLTNVAALTLAAFNRSRVDATLTLTDRELWLDTWDRESTATTVRLRWLYPVAESTSAGWFGCERLTAIGFDCSVGPSDDRAEAFYAHQSDRNAYVVFEYDGRAWRAYEDEMVRQNAQMVAKGGGQTPEQFARDLAGRSHLIAIDAGPDPDVLRRAYPDSSTCLIAAARVSISRFAGGRDHPSYIRGNITGVLPDTLTVPRAFAAPLRAVIESSRTQDWAARRPTEGRFSITVSYGRRHEPWITAVTAH